MASKQPAAQAASTSPSQESPSSASTPAPSGPVSGDAAADPAPQGETLLVDQPTGKKWRNWWVRALWTLIMIGGFAGVLAAGHIWVVLLIIVIQTLVYLEVISIGYVRLPREKKVSWFRSMHWYFLGSTNYFLYGESIIHFCKQRLYIDFLQFVPLATHHRFISFALYCVGFIFFVINLKKGHYKAQFSQFGWTHMTLLLVICQSHFIINNIFEGLFWFVLPVSLVICNDIMAYIFGFFFGRTPLIRLSPKKTWEGFVGALFSTLVFGFVVAGFLSQYPYMICPVRDLHTTSLSTIDCTPNPVFVPREILLPATLHSLLEPVPILNQLTFVKVAPVQFHAVVMACFASLIAPFGGFFASGFKRAFKIKDFGDSIPGHGGITDRMDCQFLMGLFSYMYYQSFIGTGGTTVGEVLHLAITSLSDEEKLQLYADFGDYLRKQGLLP
ncbi:cytidylyltransferase family-domain-containing protein [Polychytrium aggregatum]|uniref:cytidylyltransferase family-domain-containing protein n=1 Tax=Polychytrium aggregatum TaxID=110093 RepID=UPI0022FDB8B5|nr:cytidylyltransferase family-domain-containing protein [Polychytrium aggregatum]KAI9203854.1 cytidylyltransferase family-domain-containing protein [Polychytrium aggregatum]